MRIILIIILCLCLNGLTWAQNIVESIVGEVTFITEENIYVRFENTAQIQLGDTLFLIQANSELPCLIAKQKSSSSVVCTLLSGCDVQKNNKILLKNDSVEIEELIEGKDIILNQEDSVDPLEAMSSFSEKSDVDNLEYRQKIKGRVSLANYSNLSLDNSTNNRHRAMGRFSLNADHIADSKFSFRSYLNYRQNFISSEVETDRRTKFFRVYNLSLTYDARPDTKITIGRNINRKMSSVGAIDGLQIDKSFGNFYAGAIIGFRPDLSDYGFNSALLQYGAYGGIKADRSGLYMETTMGVIEQRNGGAIDRRYAYFQHRSTINKNLNLFGSAELDLYSSINGVTEVKPRLTNLFVSARYRFSRKVSFSLSYDARKRIIYYETLRSDIDRLLADDETRQGLRARINFRLKHGINLGMSYSKRFQNSAQNKSDNINGFITKSSLPSIGGSLSLRINWNKSSYLDSKIVQLGYSRSLFERKLQTNFYVKNVLYTYFNNEVKTSRQYYGTTLTWRLMKKLSLGVSGELSLGGTSRNCRINTRLIKRF